MRRFLLLLFFVVSGLLVHAQRPSGFPTQKNLGWMEWGWMKSDSGFISAVRDTNFIPRFAGTRIMWQRPGVDTAEWFYTGQQWIKILRTGDGGNVNNRYSIAKAINDSLQLVNDILTSPERGKRYIYGFDTTGNRNFVEDKYIIAKVDGELRALRDVDTSHIYRGIINGIVGDWVYDPNDVSSSDDSAMTIIAAGNKRLKRFYEDFVAVSWFGAKPGDGVDDWRAIQKAINWVIANNDKTKTLLFDKVGVYNISQPLVCYRWTGTDYTQFQINLIGVSSGKMPVSANMVQISASFNDKFILGIHKARAGTVKNILMIGNYSPGLTQKQAWESRRSAWQNSSGRDDTYSPYSGIVIDPFRFDTTGINGGYPGMAAWYRGSTSTGGSSGITIENCYITNFVVGVMISPNTTTLNAENILISDCRIETCMSAIAQGQAQTKGNYVKNLVTWGMTHTVIDCANYGLRDGYAPIIDGVNIAGTCHQIIDQRTNTAIPVVVKNVFAEGLFKLGRITSPRTHVFRDCEFRFAQYVNANIGDPDRLLLATNVEFDGCAMTSFTTSANAARINFSNEPFTFRNCVFNSPPITAETADVTLDQRAAFYNCRGVLYGSFGNLLKQTFDFNSTTKNTPIAGLEMQVSSGSASATNTFTFTDALDVMVLIGSRDVIVDTVTRTAKIVMTGLLGTIQEGDYIMSTFSSATKDTTLYGTVDKNPCVGRVTSVTADTIYLDHVPVSVRISGTRTLYVNYYRKIGALLTGDIINGQDTIRNVEVYKNLWPSPGDRLENSSNQMTAGMYVVSVDQANAKIVMSRTFTTTASHVDFFMGNPKVVVNAFRSPDNVGGAVFQFKGAEWNIMQNDGIDSIGHKYIILRSGPFNSTLHPKKNVKVWPSGDNRDINNYAQTRFVSDQNYSVVNADFSIVYNSATTTRTITLPAVASNNKRLLVIHNPTDQSLATSLAIRQNSTTTYTSIPANTSVYITCDGGEWREIFRASASGTGTMPEVSEPLHIVDGGSDPDTLRLAGLTSYGAPGQMVRTNVSGDGWEYFTPQYVTQSALDDTAADIRAAVGAFSGSGTENYLTKWTGATSLGNSLAQDNGTGFSIGGAPSSSLFSVLGRNSRIEIHNGTTTIGEIVTSVTSGTQPRVDFNRVASSGNNIVNLFGLTVTTNIGTHVNTISTPSGGDVLVFSVNGSERARWNAFGGLQLHTSGTTPEIIQRGLFVNRSIGMNPDSSRTITDMGSDYLQAISASSGEFLKILPSNLGFTTTTAVAAQIHDSLGTNTTVLRLPLIAYAGEDNDPDSIGIAGINGFGTAGQSLRVNATEDGMEWYTPTGGGGITSINSETGPTFTIAGANGITVNTTTNTATAVLGGTLSSLTTINGASNSLLLGASGSKLFSFTVHAEDDINLNADDRISLMAALSVKLTVVTDADFSVTTNTMTVVLKGDLSASRTITLPSAQTGMLFIIQNQNSNASFDWNISTLIGPDGSSVTTLDDDTVYMIQGVYDGDTAYWVVISTHQ